jgi:hypothetical protein
MKGIAPLIIAAFVIGVAMISEIAYLTSFIAQSEPVIRIVRETEIIDGINRLEFAKQYFLKAALYSYEQASYDIAKRGGYFDITDNSFNCIPYWQIYSQSYAPDLNYNIKAAISGVFTKYIATANINGVTFPTSFAVDISNHNTMTIHSDDTMKVGTSDFYIAEEQFLFSQSVDGKIFNLFKIAQSVSDSLIKLQANTVSYSDLQQSQQGSKLDLLQSALNEQFGSSNVQVTFKSENLGPSDTSYAARILVTISDNSAQYPTYDFSTKTFDERNLNLQFYMLLGNANIPAQTNRCLNINY